MSESPPSKWPRTALIVQEIRRMVRSGEITHGARVPSENEISDMFGVTSDTANRALQVLKDEALITRRRGIGSIAAAVPAVRPVILAPGDRITARIPTPEEQAETGAGDWEVVLVVTKPGQPERLYPVSQVVLVMSGQAADQP